VSALETLRSFHPPTSTSTDAPSLSSSNVLQSSTSHRVQQITSSLEFSVDKFATNIHALNALKDGADRVAGEVLAISAEALEERERAGRRRDGDEGEEKEEVGMRDVLRGLSRVVDR
ncbi:MAG: hypothetical protein L6R39_003566, partial [Caloplaca ligustica]